MRREGISPDFMNFNLAKMRRENAHSKSKTLVLVSHLLLLERFFD